MLQRAEEEALNDYFELGSFVPLGKPVNVNVSPEQAQAAVPIARRALSHLEAMYAIGAGTLDGYDNALK